MKNKRIAGNEEKYVLEVLKNEFRTSKGAEMSKRFESEFAGKFQMKYGISFSNGTSTMHAALEAMGVGVGDEVIVPPLTMSATTFAVLQANATPIYADVDPNTFQIDPKSIEERITKRTKAIITVSLFGLSPDMDPIMDIAKKFNLKVIEDNAECFMGRYKGRLVGTIGDCSSFSFQSSKHLTSGEGGIILTNSLSLAEDIRKVQCLGYAGVSATKGKISKEDIQDPNYSRHTTMGWNYRMPELCCAVALAQTEKMEELVEKRVRAAKLFEEAVSEFSDWFTPQYIGDEYEHSYWAFVCKLDLKKIDWYTLRKKFRDNGGDGVYAAWKLSYLEPMFQNRSLLRRELNISNEILSSYKLGLCPIAEDLQGRLFQFKTNYWDIDRARIQAEILNKTLKYFR